MYCYVHVCVIHSIYILVYIFIIFQFNVNITNVYVWNTKKFFKIRIFF